MHGTSSKLQWRLAQGPPMFCSFDTKDYIVLESKENVTHLLKQGT